MRSDDPLPDGQPTAATALLADRYQLLDMLGEGGMGTVWRARDGKLDRQVAIKLLPAGSIHDAAAVARFNREARALAHLSHPGIIQAYDSGQHGDRHFLVMELVNGRSLAVELADKGALPPTRAADYVHQAALALEHAHRNGLVHRDVKPSNLLVTADGRVKLLDLGLARFLQDQVGDTTLTREGMGMGTPDYVAPEQFRDAHKADPRSDIYSLGCTLYQLIAGRVPFPGSSLSEKMQAHESREPPPLEEHAPDMPAGLALIVGRMLAKRPEDRFRNMAEVAQALGPYVATSSPSFRVLRDTATWQAGQLTTVSTVLRRRTLAPWLALGAVATVCVAVGLVWLAVSWFRPGDAPAAYGPDAVDAAPARGVHAEAAKGETPQPQRDPNVLTVSQKPDGGGEFRTIKDALERIAPYQTLRIVDGGHYRETVLLNKPDQHQGIVLEAPAGAVLETATDRSSLITVNGVKGVILRDLNLRAVGTQMCALVTVNRAGPDVVIEHVNFAAESGATYMGVEMINLPAHTDGSRPNLRVVSCTFRNAAAGVNVVGALASAAGYGNATPVHGVLVRDNAFIDCQMGILLRGEIHSFRVVANRFLGCQICAYQLDYILDASEDVLIANNTSIHCTPVLRVWDNQARTRGVRFSNNLNLASSYPDCLFLDSGGSPNVPKGPGDGAILLKSWRFDHNGREVKVPSQAPAKPDGWIAATAQDMVKDRIDGINRDPKSPHFLRPDKDSPLATAGAGNTDPSLPRYVGALPPEGAEPWDWERALRMPKDALLLTVSKDAGGGGKYRTINGALKDAKPWTTIRVLDAETYEETIRLTDRAKYEGLMLEAAAGATLHLAKGERRLITIADVPHVRLTGFRCTEGGLPTDPTAVTRAFVMVSGTVPGITLTRLKLTPKVIMLGLVLQNAAGTRAAPLRIEDCTIRPSCSVCNDGISVIGNLPNDPAGGVCIRGNRIFNSQRGINLHGSLRDIHVVGNLVANSPACGIQLEDVAPGAHGLLVANNTVFGGQSGIRLWDNIPFEPPVHGQVEVANNLAFSCSHADLADVLDPGQGKDQSPGDGNMLLKLWRFHHNYRDYSGANPNVALPSGGAEGRLTSDQLLTQDIDDLDRIRPTKDSPLATQGAGAKDGSLPRYIGWLPRVGEPTWDWDRTWRARVRRDVRP